MVKKKSSKLTHAHIHTHIHTCGIFRTAKASVMPNLYIFLPLPKIFYQTGSHIRWTAPVVNTSVCSILNLRRKHFNDVSTCQPPWTEPWILDWNLEKMPGIKWGTYLVMHWFRSKNVILLCLIFWSIFHLSTFLLRDIMILWMQVIWMKKAIYMSCLVWMMW